MPDQAKVASVDGSHVMVIGAGWAGWGAAKALCEAGVRVTLVDGMSDPTCLLYTSPSPRDLSTSRMPSSA